MAEMKTEDGKKERYYLYYDGESVSGKVCNVNRIRENLFDVIYKASVILMIIYWEKNL